MPDRRGLLTQAERDGEDDVVRIPIGEAIVHLPVALLLEVVPDLDLESPVRVGDEQLGFLHPDQGGRDERDAGDCGQE